jgi:hypothetical protein
MFAKFAVTRVLAAPMIQVVKEPDGRAALLLTHRRLCRTAEKRGLRGKGPSRE